MMNKKNLDARGFTLVELMLVLLLTGIVAAAAFSAYLAQQKTYYVQSEVVEMQQNIRAGMQVLGTELRMAGYDPMRTDNFGFVNGTTARNQLQFTLDLNNNGAIDGVGETISFGLSGIDATSDGLVDNIDLNSDGRIDSANDTPVVQQVTFTRNTGGGAQAIAENIQGVEFFYTLEDGTQTLTPAAEVDDIRAVQITLLAVTDSDDDKFTNGAGYTTGSGATWGPFNDNYRRRILTYNINCRNMGLK